jgi:hypothetical protein
MSSGAFFPPGQETKNPALMCAEASGVRWVKAIKFNEEKRKKIAALVDQLAQMKTPE